jgi:uncharacterized protein YdeI (YjbR/CyaY-like superfamily)
VAREGKLRARLRIKGFIDKEPIATSLQSSGEGWLGFVVNKELLKKLDRAPGDSVEVAIEVDEGPVIVDLPRDFVEALRIERRAKAVFDALAPSHKRAYVRWIASAKREETRARRIREAMAMLAEGKKLR